MNEEKLRKVGIITAFVIIIGIIFLIVTIPFCVLIWEEDKYAFCVSKGYTSSDYGNYGIDFCYKVNNHSVVEKYYFDETDVCNWKYDTLEKLDKCLKKYK